MMENEKAKGNSQEYEKGSSGVTTAKTVRVI